MLTIEKLQKASDIINIKNLCREADVKYDTIIAKIYRNRKNSKHGELNVKEAIKLTEILEKKGLA